MQCFGDLIAMEGTNANEPCRIGSIRPRRQARERRSLQTFQITGPLWKNNGFNAADVFAACAEPTPDNQYTTFKPTHELVHAAMRNHLLIEFEPSHLNRPLTQNGKWLL